jgi:anti-anti-sigma regulatory factor
VVWIEGVKGEMLKLTLVQEDEKAVTLKLEGRIIGQWVNELKKECERCMGRGNRLILDLSGVTFVDVQGIRMLRAVCGDQVKLIGCSLFLSGLLENEEGASV